MQTRPRPSRRRRTPTERLLSALLLAFVCFFPQLALARPASVVIEIDVAAERVVDARSTRRLIPLELADVSVPAAGAARSAELFFRVLGREGGLRVELWERGEFHGARALSRGGESPQLLARRVALAAAELGRRLARKRDASQQREARLKAAREARERARRSKTQDGPVALRSELGFASVPGRYWAMSSRSTVELTLRRALRLDLGAEGAFGRLESAGWAELYGVSLGPAHRFVLTPWLDADVGARAAVLSLQLPRASTLDGVSDQQGSWTALAAVSGRLELRLTRQLRLGVGAEVGGLLRTVGYIADGSAQRLRGAWYGASLGLVVTPL